MTIKTSLIKLQSLKAKILEDQKVDYTEAEVLLDFIAPYCRYGETAFCSLHKLLSQAVEDKVIDQRESKEIVEAIAAVEKKL